MSRDFSGFSSLSVLYVYFSSGFIVRLVRVSRAWFFRLFTLIIVGQLQRFSRCLFAAVSAVHWEHDKAVNIRGYSLPLQLFLSPDNVQIRKKIITYVLNIIVGQKFSRKVFFFPDRKQFNLALGEGCGGACTVSTIQSHRLLLLSIKQQKLYYTQGQPSIFCEVLRRAAATCQIRLAGGQM